MCMNGHTFLKNQLNIGLIQSQFLRNTSPLTQEFVHCIAFKVADVAAWRG
jgi:hypothetical protein